MCRDKTWTSSDEKVVVILSARNNKTYYCEKRGEKSKHIGTKAIPEEIKLNKKNLGYYNNYAPRDQGQNRDKQGQIRDNQLVPVLGIIGLLPRT